MILFGLILLAYALANLKDVLVPLAFSLLLAILLNPLASRLQVWKIPRVLAIVIALLAALIIIAAIGYFLSSQIAGFTDQLPLLKQKFTALLLQLQKEASERFGLNMQKQREMIVDAESNIRPLVGHTLGTLAGSVFMMVLLPVYTFLFMYYKVLILNFLYEIFAEENSKEVGTVLRQTKAAIQNYMRGLLLEAIIVAALNSAALMLLGVEYAILLGVLGAILNVLPYIGGIIAIALPVIIASITKDGFQTQLGIIAAYMIIQFIDNHFLVPYIVSSRVKINALISIVVVLLGDALWGVPGMFLSIPFIGVLKIIFDRVPELKPWGKLLGDEVPTRHKGELWSIRRKKVV